MYLVTLYPGIGDGDGDSAKFAFLGRVLGTAHPPGYPAYVLISHLFSYLPIGTLAYRINAMSAVFAALGAVAAYASMRALAVRTWAAAGLALGLAFGALYWSKAVLAEVYSLNACLVAMAIAALLWWGRTRRTGLLLAAVACASVAFGNHLTSVAMVPAYIAFALLTDRRACLRPKVLAAVAGIVALGIAQYGFIILRTIQQAPYLEARATSMTELWDVVTARRYADAMFQIGWWDLVTARVPELARLTYAELGLVSTLLAVVGLVALCRYRWREAVLLAGGAAGVLGLTLNIDADIKGFVLPAFVACWTLAGAGLEYVAGELAGRWARGPVMVVVVVALGVPAAQVYSNVTLNDHRRATAKTTYFNALMESLPSRAVVVGEDYPTDTAVLYELLGERAQGGRDIRRSPADPVALRSLADQGFEIYAFRGGRSLLERFGYRFAPHRMLGPSLGDYLRRLKPGWIVAIAGTPGTLRVLPLTVARAFAGIGAALDAAGPTQGPFGVVGVRGAPSGAVVVRGTDVVDIAPAPQTAFGGMGVSCRVPFRVSSDSGGAAITLDGKEVARTPAGLLVAVFRSDGVLVDAEAVDPDAGFRVPVEATIRPISRATYAARCGLIANQGWVDVSSDASTGRMIVRVDNARPFEARVSIYITADEPLSPVVGETGGRGRPQVFIERFDAAAKGQLDELTVRATLDRMHPETVTGRGRHVVRVDIAVNDGGDYATVAIDAGGRPTSAVARAVVDRSDPSRATVCSAPPRDSR